MKRSGITGFVRSVLAGRCCLVLFLAASAVLSGEPYDAYDFSLRFPAAISRFASYADVAAEGGAQAASEWSTSANPASAAWPKTAATPKFTVSLAPQLSIISFDSGGRLTVTAESATIDAGNNGVFLPAAAQVRSNHLLQRDGLGFRFEAQYYQLQWARLVDPEWTVGAVANVTNSTIDLDVDGFRVASSRSEAYNLRVGVVHALRPRLRWGATAEFAISPSRTDATALDSATGKPVALHSTDTAHQLLGGAQGVGPLLVNSLRPAGIQLMEKLTSSGLTLLAGPLGGPSGLTLLAGHRFALHQLPRLRDSG